MIKLLKIHRKMATQGAQTPWEWLLFCLLLPLSLIYGLISWLRAVVYRQGWLPRYRARVPVISVGNLAVGGTGKTPVVDWLLKEAARQGKRVAVVSRGYGGSYKKKVGVVADGTALRLSAAEAGDEPVLLARRNPTAIILVARKRAAGVKYATTRFAVDLVVLDDAFQHHAVRRDLDLVLLDALRPFGNRWPLPAGLLREFPRAVARADLLLLTRAGADPHIPPLGRQVYLSRHQLAEEAYCLDGGSRPLHALRGLKVFAFAGLAAPEGFFTALKQAGLKLEGCLPLADHCRYSGALVDKINALAENCDLLLTTEKDAVKLSHVKFHLPCYQVPMDILIENHAAFKAELHKLWRPEMRVSPELMEILACPKCKQAVELAEDGLSISCAGCRLRYPVRDGIPVMLLDEAVED